MAGKYTLKVEQGRLVGKASEISSLIQSVEQEFAGLQSAVNASAGYWTGNAGGAYRKYLENMEPDMQKVLRRLKEHPKDLLQIMGAYTDVETKIATQAAGLPADVIK